MFNESRFPTPGASSHAGASTPARRAALVVLGSAALLLAARLVGAQQPAAPSGPQQQGNTVVMATPATAITRGVTVEGITEYALANGLRVLLFPDQSKATVTV